MHRRESKREAGQLRTLPEYLANGGQGEAGNVQGKGADAGGKTAN
jgi:hypothetical protein